MQKSVPFLFLLIILYSCNTVPAAAELKHGKFFYNAKNEQVRIIRYDSTQVETSNMTGDSMVFDIEWKTDSAYYISRRIKPSTVPDSSGRIFAPVVHSRKIILITPEYYVVISSHDEYSLFAGKKDTVWIDELHK